MNLKLQIITSLVLNMWAIQRMMYPMLANVSSMSLSPASLSWQILLSLVCNWTYIWLILLVGGCPLCVITKSTLTNMSSFLISEHKTARQGCDTPFRLKFLNFQNKYKFWRKIFLCSCLLKLIRSYAHMYKRCIAPS